MTARSRFRTPLRGALASLALALLVACGEAKPTQPTTRFPNVIGMWDLESVNGHALPTRIASSAGHDSTDVLFGELEILASRYRQHLRVYVWPGTLGHNLERYDDGPWQAIDAHQLSLGLIPVSVIATISGDVTVMTFKLDGDLYSYRKR